MISCEEFERRYPEDNSIEVLEHQQNCPFCAFITAEVSELRKELNCIPQLCTPVGFEARLFNRIRALESVRRFERRSFPNALAFASGLTLALVAGTLYYNHYIKNYRAVTQSPIKTELMATTEVAQDTTEEDTLKSVPTTPLIENWNLEIVSAQP